STTIAASGVGIAGDQAADHGISTPSTRLLLWRDDLRVAAAGRAARAVRSAADRLHGVVDGLLPSKQTPHGRVPFDVAESTVLPGDDHQIAEPGDRRRAVAV